MNEQDPTSNQVLTEAECWELLRAQEFGRLAYVLDDRANIVPINYAVDDGDPEQPQLVFRTAGGSKTHAIIGDQEVAFEIDEVVDEVGQSVVVQGLAWIMPPSEEPRLEQVGLRAWLGQDKPILVSIRPEEVTGRRYELKRPWKRMMR